MGGRSLRPDASSDTGTSGSGSNCNGDGVCSRCAQTNTIGQSTCAITRTCGVLIH